MAFISWWKCPYCQETTGYEFDKDEDAYLCVDCHQAVGFVCDECGGSGQVGPEDDLENCEACEGDGIIIHRY